MAMSEYTTYNPQAGVQAPVAPVLAGEWFGDLRQREQYDTDLKKYNELQGDIDMSGKPTDIMAAVTRARWEDVKNNYLPIEDDVMQQLTFMNPEMVTGSIESAQATATEAMANMAGVRERNISRYGMNQTAEQKEATSAGDALGSSLAGVNAANTTRAGLLDRDKDIMMGSSAAIGG